MMNPALNDAKAIKLDRMRYTKNTCSSRLTYLAILFDVLYFVSIFESDVGSWYYKMIIGGSIVYNLVFMLMAFLSSEGVKNYKVGYSVLLCVLGVGQIIRIFILPMMALNATVTISKVTYSVMEPAQFTWVVICLCLSAASCLAAGIIGVIRGRTLAAYNASLEAAK